MNENYNWLAMILCGTLLIIILIIRVTDNTTLLIKGGYKQVQQIGATGVLWVK